MDGDQTRSDADIEEAVSRIRLPSCPAIVTKLSLELRAEDPNFAKIGKLIGSDVSLSGAMLKTVNSAFYGLQVTVGSVHQALTILGLSSAAQLVTGFLLQDAFKTATVRMQSYWQSTSKLALLSACLARALRLVDREEAYTFALFRDSGALAMMADMEHYEPVLPGDALCGRAVLDAEESAYGIDHAEIGYHLTKSWLLPEHLCQAVRLHHDYAACGGDGNIEVSTARHIALAIASEWLYVTKLHGSDCPLWSDASEFVLQTLGTSEETLLRVVQNATGL